jgi:hypothetical protein
MTSFTFHLEFNPYDAEHRQIASWLADQPDPAEAVVRLVKAANEGERRLARWEQLAAQLANEVQAVRAQLKGQPSQVTHEPDGVHEDPESARRLDSIFKATSSQAG